MGFLVAPYGSADFPAGACLGVLSELEFELCGDGCSEEVVVTGSRFANGLETCMIRPCNRSRKGVLTGVGIGESRLVTLLDSGSGRLCVPTSGVSIGVVVAKIAGNVGGDNGWKMFRILEVADKNASLRGLGTPSVFGRWSMLLA
jgi:hypothetical protein